MGNSTARRVSPGTERAINKYFRKIQTVILWPSELSYLVAQHTADWGTYAISRQEIIDFILENSLLRSVSINSPKYRSITRYIRGDPSAYQMALSLRRNSFLCHRTALELHGLANISTTIYVNQEQADKPQGSELTQASIRLAFKNEQRHSKFKFTDGLREYVLISGKNTNRSGVIQLPTQKGEKVDVTDLERTLIDIVVRPAYAGGMDKVARAYKEAIGRIDVDHLINLLRKINHAYPYQQSIGFLMQRAGFPENHLEKLERLKSNFDFFLEYGLKDSVYDERWQVFYKKTMI